MIRAFSARPCAGRRRLTFVAEKPPPSCVFEEVALMAAEEGVEYFL